MKNKIIKLFCFLALLASVSITPAFSQAKNFAGPSIAVTGGFVSHTFASQYNDGTDTAAIANIGDNDIAYGLDLSYAFPIDQNFLIGLGITYGLNDTDAGEFLGVLKFKAEDAKSVYIQPTYAFSDSFAAFAKLGYHEVKGTATLSTDIDLGGDLGIEAGSASDTYTGVGYGVGLKGMINQNVFIQAEIQYKDYGSEGGGSITNVLSVSPETVSALISIGTKF
jgi:opacity protein-like surface antigen